MPASLTDLGRSAGKAQKARSRARPSEPEKIQFISAILSWHGWQTSRCSSKSRCADDGSVPIAYCSMAFLRRCIREIVHPTQKYSQINFGQNHLGKDGVTSGSCLPSSGESLHRTYDIDAFTALCADKSIDYREARKGVQRSAVRAACAANRVRVRQLLHDSLNVFDSHSTDHRPTFVAKDIRLAFAYADS